MIMPTVLENELKRRANKKGLKVRERMLMFLER